MRRSVTQKHRRNSRRAVVAVEAAMVLPVLIVLLFGVWEVGRLVQVQQLLTNAAREGARAAAGGYINGTPVSTTTVENNVRTYLYASGLPSTAVLGTQVNVTNLSGNSWTHPSDALPLDAFRVTVTIPSGAPFDSLRWALVNRITGVTQMSASVDWRSATDSKITVDTTIPL
ncbi:MAG: pilus assembly protein [Pirellulales bacterium]|nr:pilus assembly protein [Pirellulales bacterium]